MQQAKRSPGRLQTAESAHHFSGASETLSDEEAERGPLRRCLVTRDSGPKEKMIRFALAPDRLMVPDLAARLPGRGFWLSARADVLEPARARGAFARAAKGPVTLPPDLATSVEQGLRRRIVEFLGLCRRSGQAVAGFTKAREWIEAGKVGLVVEAIDGSEEERHRLVSGARDLAIAWPLDAASLGAVFGRERVVHGAVARGRLAGALMNEIERLGGVSGQPFMKQAG